MNAPVRELTTRQKQVVRLFGEGKTFGEVARHLGVRLSTLRAHVRGIALALPNPHGKTPLRLIREWANRDRAA